MGNRQISMLPVTVSLLVSLFEGEYFMGNRQISMLPVTVSLLVSLFEGEYFMGIHVAFDCFITIFFI